MPAITSINQHTELNLSKQLKTWAKINHVRPVDLHRATGWSYQYCHGLLTGNYKFGHASFGLFVLIYGFKALEDIFRMAEIQTGEK